MARQPRRLYERINGKRPSENRKPTMTEFIHHLPDGRPVRIAVRFTAKKNIILRPLAADALRVSAPKWLGRRGWRAICPNGL